MPDRIFVPMPEPNEELREIAEAASDIHYILGIIVEEGAKELLPGESIEEAITAWQASNITNGTRSFDMLIKSLLGFFPEPGNYPVISHELLGESQLTGEVGKAKRSMLSRLKDKFFMHWYSEPRTDEKRNQAANAAIGYLEFAGTFISSIPGYESIVELISLVMQLIDLRAKRGS